MNKRSDEPLIRHLAARQPGAARIYNALPLLVAPEKALFAEYEWQIFATAPAIIVPPFKDFLLELPFGVQPVLQHLTKYNNLDRGKLWVRARVVSAFKKDGATSLNPEHLSKVKNPDEWLLLEGWAEHTAFGNLPDMPDYSLVPLKRADAVNYCNYWHAYPTQCRSRTFGMWCNINGCINKEVALCAFPEILHTAMCCYSLLAIVYYMQELGGAATEVAWKPSPFSPDEQTENSSPWLVPRRATYITVDPDRAEEYCHPPTDCQHPTDPPISHWRAPHPDTGEWPKPQWKGSTIWTSGEKAYTVALPPRRHP